MHRFLIAPAVVLFWVVLAEPVIASPKAMAQLPPEEQEFIQYMRRLESDGYVGVKTISFSKMGVQTKSALSVIVDKKGRSGPLHFVEISEPRGANGPYIMFRVYSECNVTDMQGKIPETIIKVDGQKIGAYSVCGLADKGDTQRLFIPKTDAGKAALYSTFKSRKLVFTILGGTEIPFDTHGFEAAWEEASAPAL